LSRQGEAAISTQTPHDTASRDALIEEYAPLVRYIAERLCVRLPAFVDNEDLVGTGMLGLMDAIEKFVPDRGVKFRTYAEFRIRGAMLDYLRRQDWATRSLRRKEKELSRAARELEQELHRPATHEEIAKRLNVSTEQLNDLLFKAKGLSLLSLNRPQGDGPGEEERELAESIPDETTRGPYEMLEKQEVRDLLSDHIHALPEKERLVVTMYYFQDLTMKEVGKSLGVTESRVSQLHSSAILRLKGRLEPVF